MHYNNELFSRALFYTAKVYFYQTFCLKIGIGCNMGCSLSRAAMYVSVSRAEVYSSVSRAEVYSSVSRVVQCAASWCTRLGDVLHWGGH